MANKKANTQTLILRVLDGYIETMQKHKDMQSLEIADRLSVIYARISGDAEPDEETREKVETLYEAFGKFNK